MTGAVAGPTGGAEPSGVRRSSTKPAVLVWGVALAAYAVGVFHRSSLAVAGLEAADRFGLDAARLSWFVVLQLLVYAVTQVPVGLLVDRHGARRVLIFGTLSMSVGQAVFAVAGSYELALVGRALVGVGDGVVFVCVLRLVLAWFPPRRVPLMTQLTGPVGQIGAILAAGPAVWTLGAFGWERFYLGSAAFGLLVVAVLLLLVDDEPGIRRRPGAALSWTTARAGVALAWANPGARLGFWVHFTHHFSASMVGLLWGFPFFVVGQGTTEAQAGALLSLLLATIVVAGPATGWWIARRPALTLRHVVVSTAAVAIAWTVVLAWPGGAPLWVLAALVLAIGATGPAALIGFEFGRVGTPTDRLGITNAIVNQGGFLASLGIIVVVGLLLDATDRSAPSSWTLAMCAQYPLWALGLFQMYRHRRTPAPERARSLSIDPQEGGRPCPTTTSR
ncbi:MFS transporter [Nocardioides sp. SYSU DS0651]|uniref:MFS transporter n=1 Tax=Nocardioides sp. SYSU DS0651 TaxID=3415955 RepID=UPI003F4B0885